MFSSDQAVNQNAGSGYGQAGSDRAGADRRGPLFDPVQLFGAVWNARAFVIATTIAGALLAVMVALSTPKTYVATTQVLVDPRDIKVVQNEVTPNGLPSEATLALIESQLSVIYSNGLLARAVEAEDLTNDPEFADGRTIGPAALLDSLRRMAFGADEAADERTRELQTIARLREKLTVSREAKSFVLNLSVESTSPERAAELSRLIARLFMEDLARVQSDTARQATDALSSRLSDLRQSVVEAERAVETYKAENALIGVGGRLVDDQYILQITEQLARARGDITETRVRAQSMQRASIDDVVEGTFPEELTSEALSRLRTTYSDLAQESASLAARLGPRHPQRIASQEALASAREAIAAELARIVAAAQTELARATRTEAELTRQIDELKTEQVATSGAFVRLRELEREVDASRAVYESFLLRARETGQQQSLNTANVRIISQATPPLEPSGTSRKTVVIAGAILGGLAGIAIAAGLALVRALRNQASMPLGSSPNGFGANLAARRHDDRPREEEGEPAIDSALALRPSPATLHHERISGDDARPDRRPEMLANANFPLRRRATDLPALEAPSPARHDDARNERAPAPPADPESSLSALEQDRRNLRIQLRGIATQDHGTVKPNASTADAQVVRLQNEIAGVRRELAEMRLRRSREAV